jgi:DNA-directed RNA polymerase beta subunit
VNTYVHENDAVVGKCLIKTELEDDTSSNIFNNKIKKELYYDKSYIADKTVAGIVDKVYVYNDGENTKTCKIRYRKFKIPELGDKLASCHGQKGVIGCIMEDADMPFTKDGHRIDLIINPHAIPSRMTIGHLLETMMAKYAVSEGIILDGTPFNGNDYEWIQDKLESKYNFERYGNEVLYNGRTGEQIETEIFIGPIMYQRLKHMVSDKINYRSTGPRQATTRQPVKGRSNNGGLRIGEMERDSLLSHGMMAFIKESMMERADNYECDIEKSTGDIAITNKKTGTFKPQKDDGRFFSSIKVPYAFKLLTQEIKGLGVKPYISTDPLSDDDGVDDAEAEILLQNMSESDDESF